MRDVGWLRGIRSMRFCFFLRGSLRLRASALLQPFDESAQHRSLAMQRRSRERCVCDFIDEHAPTHTSALNLSPGLTHRPARTQLSHQLGSPAVGRAWIFLLLMYAAKETIITSRNTKIVPTKT